MQTSFTITSNADLRAAIAAIDIGGVDAAATSYTIRFAGPGGLIALAGNLPAVNLTAGASLTLDGGGGMLSGSGVARGFYVYAGSVTIQNMVIAATVATGAAGSAGVDGGGGGAGLGGGLFIADSGVVTLNNVVFAQDAAVGGAGGASVNPQSVVSGSASVVGAAGGFAGGGAGGGTGGAGGFGGGGGGGATGGVSQFGGGVGGSNPTGAGGGGGLAAGGDIFVHGGGSLYLQAGTLAAGSLSAGSGASGGGSGQALGSALFLSGSQAFSLHPAAGQTLEIDGVIADTPIAGAPAGMSTTGSGGVSYGSIIESRLGPPALAFGVFPDPYAAPDLRSPAAGTVVLKAANGYSSTTVVYGTLDLATPTSAGTGTIDLSGMPSNSNVPVDTTLRIQGTVLPGNPLSGLKAGDVVVLPDISIAPTVIGIANGMTLPGATGTLSIRYPSTSNTQAFRVTADPAGGSRLTVVDTLLIGVQGQAGLLLPFGNDAYLSAASPLLLPPFTRGAITLGTASKPYFVATPGATTPTLSSANGGTVLLHQGAATLAGGYKTLISDALAPVSVTGGAQNGEVVEAGDGGLSYTAGLGSATVLASGGNNLMLAGANAGDQVFLLGNGADTVSAAGGNVTVDGNTGGKLVGLGSGNGWFIGHGDLLGAVDTVSGGSGAATITANSSNIFAGGFGGALCFIGGTGSATVLAGGAGGTSITAGPGDLTAVASAAVSVVANGGTSVITGGSAGERLTYVAAAASRATLSGGIGSMTVSGAVSGLLLGGTGGANSIASSGAVTIVGGGDGDVLALTGSGVVYGGSGAETLNGTGAASGAFLVGGTGADLIRSGTSGTMLYAGPGSDTILASGADTVVGGTGFATVQAQGRAMVFGGAGGLAFANGGLASTVVGGSGGATVLGGVGGGVFVGGSGRNNLTADGGAATLVGGGSDDVLTASNAAPDLLVGGGGAETLAAGAGSDMLYAGTGPDLLLGGAGTSVLVAGIGADTLVGGSGLTLFAFNNGRGGGSEVVTGWNPVHHSVALGGFGGPTAGLAGMSQAGGDTLVSLTDGTTIRFIGVVTLSTSSFI